MTNIIKGIIFAIITAIVSWLSLSYIFFPIKLSAPADEYFVATISHMIPLKFLITALFVVFIVFLYKQRLKKIKNK